ncbi:MAG: hypothetical protein J6W23_07780, partial [Victivallales bacterium]|nr:hypothetical protein [Victivallales bacterium]
MKIYISLMIGIFCFLITGCDFLIKSEYVSYEYKKFGMELCGWEKDKTISKIILYKNKSNDIDLGIKQNNEMIPFGDKDSETLKQFGFLPDERQNNVFYLTRNNNVLTINLNEDESILYMLTVSVDSPFVILYNNSIITIPIEQDKIQHLFGNDVIRSS